MIEKDTSRVRYLSPEEGVDYGLIDKVLYPEELRVQVMFFLTSRHSSLDETTKLLSFTYFHDLILISFYSVGTEIYRFPISHFKSFLVLEKARKLKQTDR